MNRLQLLSGGKEVWGDVCEYAVLDAGQINQRKKNYKQTNKQTKANKPTQPNLTWSRSEIPVQLLSSAKKPMSSCVCPTGSMWDPHSSYKPSCTIAAMITPVSWFLSSFTVLSCWHHKVRGEGRPQRWSSSRHTWIQCIKHSHENVPPAVFASSLRYMKHP